MEAQTDMELLKEFAQRNSDAAFAALVSRHLNLVYSAALRKTGNPHAAEEITQTVFIILAQKAGRISEKTILEGWLYQTARLGAASLLRRESRRARREQEAYMRTELASTPPDETWEQLAPLLDDAMGRLGEKDRSAVVLRFFRGKSFAEVGTASGISENAAKKRVGHALEKLHRYFFKRGVSSTTAIIAAAISAHSVQAAPLALAESVTSVAFAKGVVASGSTLTLIKGVLRLMAWTKAKTAIIVGTIMLLTLGTTIVTVKTRSPSLPPLPPVPQLRNGPGDAFALGFLGHTNDAAGNEFVAFFFANPKDYIINLTPLTIERFNTASGQWKSFPYGPGKGIKVAPGKTQAFYVPRPEGDSPWRLVFSYMPHEQFKMKTQVLIGANLAPDQSPEAAAPAPGVPNAP
jgi:RNA polymerase sigma factor (sigma-70 family)